MKRVKRSLIWSIISLAIAIFVLVRIVELKSEKRAQEQKIEYLESRIFQLEQSEK